MTDTNKTKVIFKITPDEPRQCIAFLPGYPTWKHMIMSYMHVGQHGEASKEYMNDCTDATPKEYADLKAELESIGYNLDVIETPSPTPKFQWLLSQDGHEIDRFYTEEEALDRLDSLCPCNMMYQLELGYMISRIKES